MDLHGDMDLHGEMLPHPYFGLTVKPYQFEPLLSDKIERESYSESESEDSFDESDTDSDSAVFHPNDIRTDNLVWCDCENCVVMPTLEECRCCRELSMVNKKLKEDDLHLSCIIQHKTFIANCLNHYVIEVCLYEHVESEGPIDDNRPIHEIYRELAYRRFKIWNWYMLSERRMKKKVVPSCAVKKINEAFPPEDQAPFKYERP